MTYSLILPVYNVEGYLRKCLDSICCQDHPDFEVILVDDGSTDGSGAICDEYAARDCRMRVIHKKNGGVSDARNVGIGAAGQDYLLMIDPDDYVESNLLSTVDRILRENPGTDVVQFGSFEEADGKRNVPEASGSVTLLHGEEILLSYLRGEGADHTIWNKAFRRSLFRQITYPVGRVAEDITAAFQIFEEAAQMVLIEVPLYTYVQRSTSYMGQGSMKLRQDSFQSYWETYCHFREMPEMGILAAEWFIRITLQLAVLLEKIPESPEKEHLVRRIRKGLKGAARQARARKCRLQVLCYLGCHKFYAYLYGKTH